MPLVPVGFNIAHVLFVCRQLAPETGTGYWYQKTSQCVWPLSPWNDKNDLLLLTAVHGQLGCPALRPNACDRTDYHHQISQLVMHFTLGDYEDTQQYWNLDVYVYNISSIGYPQKKSLEAMCANKHKKTNSTPNLTHRTSVLSQTNDSIKVIKVNKVN